MDTELNKETCECEECHCEEQMNECNLEECNGDDSCNCKNHQCNCSNHCDEDCDCKDDCGCHSDHKKDKKNKKDKKGKKIEELEKKLKESEEKALLAKADMINYRKRKDEEITRILKYANEDIVRELLPVVDNFERAIKMDDNNLEDELSKFLEGFKMIYCNLVSILEKNEVKQIDGINKPFDPTYHQAVMTEASDKEKDMVLEVLQKGYLYKDKVIRPAMVKVSE